MAVRDHSDSRKWLHRFGWLVLIWSASVAALGLAALVLRAVMWVAGLTV